MNRFITLFLILGFQLIQPQNFSIQAYKDFLQQHQNLTTQQLFEMYPAGSFSGNIYTNPDEALYLDSIRTLLGLTQYEEQLLGQHGFMVSERLNRQAFGQSFLEIYHKDLPVYISADALLHAFHISYDRILKDIEIQFLHPHLKNMLNIMHGKMPDLYTRYGSQPAMMMHLRDADVFLTTARKLAGVTATPFFPSNASQIDSLITFVNSYQRQDIKLFSDQSRSVDFSQFKPRGHYVPDMLNPDIDKYFKAMMWLGRIELYLIAPKNTLNPVKLYNVQRQIILSYLLTELIQLSNAGSELEYIEDIVKFFVGDQDNVTYPHLLELKQSIGLGFTSEFLDTNRVKEFQDSLSTKEYANQLILSQILYRNPMAPDSIVPASSFMMFGQRFVIDSYVTGSVVYDRIPGGVCRLFPSVLDPMFALGNNAAGQLLQPELNAYNYSLNLAALRYLIDSYGEDFWGSTMYNNWLAGIREIKKGPENENLPDFMKTAAYWQRMLNTQLTSWSQLRHDNLLYAKQSYTGGSICSYPYVYLEPFPELYKRLAKIGQAGKNKFSGLSNINYYFTTLERISDSLAVIAQKQIDNVPLTQGEEYWLRCIIYNINPGSGGSPFWGWYSRLYYRDEEYDLNKGLLGNDFIVADIHTVPTYCGGAPLGAVVHVGTGPVNLGVFLVKHGEQLVAHVGPNYSFYEYRTVNYLRLDDEQWKNSYLWAAARPDWVNLYLADSTGNSKGAGATLLTETDEAVIPGRVSYKLEASNYPNPFNPSTVIRFTIPSALAHRSVTLVIYDVLGREVRSLYQGELPAGTYLAQWDGRNQAGAELSSGTYIYTITAGDEKVSGKLMLVK
ncbi:MAG: DUF3160 domain-containing protein [Ignavibacteriaceae bacterium]|nr:DUF3160 domain-containing protein [Ignavibacteriaceae bacterium]